jgi:hypothetical protein
MCLSCNKDCYVVLLDAFCYGYTYSVGGYFWMRFYPGDIYYVWGNPRRISKASCYFMNYGDLGYGDLYSIVGIFRGLTRESFFNISMLIVLWAIFLQHDVQSTPDQDH